MSMSDSVPRGHDHADERQALRDLVGDELRGGAHRAEERVLRAARPAAEHEPVEGDRAEREDVERADRDVDAVEPDLGAEDVDAVAERDDRERADRRDDREHRREAMQERRSTCAGRKCSLLSELEDVGERLQRRRTGRRGWGRSGFWKRPSSLRSAMQHDRHEVEDDDEDHERLEDLDPPRLVVADVGEDGHARVHLHEPAAGQLGGRVLGACRSARKTVPAGASERSATLAAARARPSAPTATRSPCADAEALRVGRASSTTLARGEELQRGRRPRPRAPPRSSGTCRGAGCAVGRRRVRRRLEAERARGRPAARRPRAVALRPAHAAAADLVERDAGVERAPSAASCVNAMRR